MASLKIKIERIKNGKKHISHFKENNVIMHYDIIDKLLSRINKRRTLNADYIDLILNNGYNTED